MVPIKQTTAVKPMGNTLRNSARPGPSTVMVKMNSTLRPTTKPFLSKPIQSKQLTPYNVELELLKNQLARANEDNIALKNENDRITKQKE
jgi:hypothetical protein